MFDPFRRLLVGLDGGPVILGADDRRAFAADWNSLIAAGLLAETAPATATECDSCHDPHYAPVIVEETDGHPPRWFLRCPSLGAVPVDADDLRRWAVCVPALGRPLAGRDAEERVPGLVWRLGPIPFPFDAGERVGWLVVGWRGRTGVASNLPELRAANAVTFVPAHLPPANVWGVAPPSVVVPLIDVLRVTGTGVVANSSALALFLPPEPVVVIEPADDRPRLALPAETPWEAVTLVVGDHHLELRLGAERYRAGYEELRLVNGRSGAPLGAWEALKLLARDGKLGTGDHIDTKSGTLKNNVTKLRVALQRWTGLADDPFRPVRARQPYCPRFKIRVGAIGSV